MFDFLMYYNSASNFQHGQKWADIAEWAEAGSVRRILQKKKHLDPLRPEKSLKMPKKASAAAPATEKVAAEEKKAKKGGGKEKGKGAALAPEAPAPAKKEGKAKKKWPK